MLSLLYQLIAIVSLVGQVALGSSWPFFVKSISNPLVFSRSRALRKASIPFLNPYKKTMVQIIFQGSSFRAA